jgi:phosphoglycolate phosphatase-like HAD superfamily hydrolase
MFEDKEVVVFDLDGTLVDLHLDWGVIRRALVESFPETGINSVEHTTTTEIAAAIAKALGQEHKRRAHRMIRDFEKGCPTTPIGETIAIAREMKSRGKHLAILSNNCRETIEECLEKEGLRKLFDFIVGKEDVDNNKPHPEGLFKIMKHFNASKEKTGFIGNEPVDENAAKSAGVDFMMV